VWNKNHKNQISRTKKENHKNQITEPKNPQALIYWFLLLVLVIYYLEFISEITKPKSQERKKPINSNLLVLVICYLKFFHLFIIWNLF
jgi:phosphatidylserine synthase